MDIFIPVLLLMRVCVTQAILTEVPRLQHIIVVDQTPTSWPGYPRDISIHNMANVQKLGARSDRGKHVCACVSGFILSDKFNSQFLKAEQGFLLFSSMWWSLLHSLRVMM